jgi:hypothetical protein
MKYSLLIVIMLFAMSCHIKVLFKTNAWVNSLEKVDTVTIDNTYELYVRYVVKRSDQTTGEIKPADALISPKDTIIEIEYLFKSDEYKKVIVLNNVPNNYIKLYERQNVKSLAGITDAVEINIRYLRQFRFGIINQDCEIEFIPKDDTTICHIWNQKLTANDSLLFKSITVKDSLGAQVRYIEPAFALDVVYTKVPAFKMVYNKASDTSKNILNDNTFYIAKPRKRYWVIFRFTENIKSSFKNVTFKNRLYTLPPHPSNLP